MPPILAIALLALASAAASDRIAPGARAPARWTPPALSSERYESSPAFSPDGGEVVFFRADRNFDQYRLLASRCVDGRWTAPVRPPFARDDVLEADPWISADGRRLYFVSARGSDPAQLDIFRVERRVDGGWGTPVRLPPPVNGPGAQLLPREWPGGGLVFGSQDAPGARRRLMRATWDAAGRWRVAPFPAPVNGPHDVYEAAVSADGRVLVAVIDRGARSHLYVFDRVGDGWRERGRVPADPSVFQIGPLLSPTGDRVLFAQADARDSGEWFLADLVPDPDPRWPPRCGGAP